MMGSGLASKCVDVVFDLCRHEDFSPVCLVKSLVGHQAIEKIPALLIASWAEGECPNSTGGHRVVTLLVGLDILSKFNPAMFIVVNLEAGDNGLGTERLRDSQRMEEAFSQKTERKTISITI
jgi:hypothetical protein